MTKRKLQSGFFDCKTGLFCAGALIGMVLFFCIYGVRILNPRYIQWLFYGGDLTQHYVGWSFFRQTPWQFPIGLIDGLTVPDQFSCMYTDSIPFMAVVCKLLSPVLPDPFQYFGFWGIFSFAMQGGLAALLIRRVSGRPSLCLVGAATFVVCPVFVERMYRHTALASHWLILLAFLLALSQHRIRRLWQHALTWSALAFFCVWVHMYYIPMVFLIFFGAQLYAVLRDKAWLRALVTGVCMAGATLLSMFVIGAFYGETSVSEAGLGNYCMNLNGFINSQGYGKLVKGLGIFCEGQRGEGYAYLGLGMLAGIFLCAVLLLQWTAEHGVSALLAALKKRWQLLVAGGVTSVLILLLALSPRITLGGHILLEISYPEKIVSLLSIFRASGRFAWILDYAVYLAVFALIARIGKHRIYSLIMALCLCLQAADLKDVLVQKHERFANDFVYETPLTDPAWSTICEGKKEIVFLIQTPGYTRFCSTFMAFADYALSHDLTLSCFYVARGDDDAVRAKSDVALAELRAGRARPDAIYIFLDPVDMTGTANFKVATYNEIMVGLADSPDHDATKTEGSTVERERNQFDLPGFFYFQAMNVYTGSLGAMRFRIHEDEQLHAAVWRSRLCFELAEIEAQAEFEFTDEGYHAMLRWLDDEYAKTTA